MAGLETIATIGSLAGTAFSVVGALNKASAESSAAKTNAEVSRQNAVAASEQAAAEEARQRRIARQVQGAGRAAVGASGVSLEGSPLDILEQNAINEELDALNIRYRGQLAARSANIEADQYSLSARTAKTSGYLSAAGKLLSGAASAYGNYYKGTSTAAAASAGYGGTGQGMMIKSADGRLGGGV